VTLRKEIIQDIYQIMGLSDIMRGSTNPQETLGAQQLKTQYGSTRIRDKQEEMVRIARDLVRSPRDHREKFKPTTMIEMSADAAADAAMKKKQVEQLTQQQQQAMQMIASAAGPADGAAKPGAGAADHAAGSADDAEADDAGRRSIRC
jgi:hypothetical protein